MQHIENIKKLFSNHQTKHPLLERIEAGRLYLSSGRMVACDPLITNDKDAFIVLFPKGDFTTYIYKERETECIAYTEVIFENDAITQWEMALCNGQDIKKLEDEEIFGYPVKSGMGCYMDFDTQQLLNELEQLLYSRKGEDFRGIYEEFFHEYFFNEKGAINQFASLNPKENLSNNIIAFETGYGEGFYASYIGFNNARRPVKLVTEFIEISAD